MLDFYKEQKEETEEKLKTAYRQLSNAGVGTKGDIEIRIESLQAILAKFTKEIEELKKVDDIKHDNVPNLVIVTATYSQIKKHVKPRILKLIEGKRYKSENLWDWYPFHQERNNIKEIISDFVEKSGYQPNIIYLPLKPPIELLCKIDIEKQNSIIIIDAIALIEPFKKTVKQFDTNDIKGVIIPEDTKYRKKKYDTYIEELKREYFEILRYHRNQSISQDFECTLYDKESDTINLTVKLKHIFDSMNLRKKIRNSKKDSDELTGMPSSL